MINERRSSIKIKVLALACSFAPLFMGGEATAQKAVNTSKVGGTGLYEIVVSQSTGAVYVTSAGGGARGAKVNGKVYKLDGKTLAVVDSIEVPDVRPMGLAINDKTQTLYTSSPGDKPVNAIDLKTRKVTPISNGKEKAHVREIIVDEAKNLVYVTDMGDASSIWVIDGKTNTYQYSIEEVGKTTTALALNPAKQLLYVTQMKTNEIGVVDLAQKKLVKSFPAQGGTPINLVYDSKGNRLFVADQGTNEVIVLNAETGDLIKKIPAGKGTLGVRFDPAKKRVYTANRQDGTVTVVNSDTYEVVSTLEAGSAPNTVAVNFKSGVAYVSNKTKPVPRTQGRPAASVEGTNAEKPAAPAPDLKGDTVTMIVP